MAKLTYKNESDRVYRFDVLNDKGQPVEKILDSGASAKLEKNDYLDGLVAQGIFSSNEEEAESEAKQSKPKK